MSVYKVPQDVEADDKIVGPFSFRQFIYLIIVALATAMSWFLGTIFIFLALIPMPVIVFFGALALPLKKDQPMEIFMAAIVSFYLKPHRRLWDPDGIESLIEITAPKTPEPQRTKDISQDEARRRLSYLSEVVDSQGLTVRGGVAEYHNNMVQNDVYFESQQAEDVLDEDNNITKMFDSKLEQNKVEQREAMAKIVSGEVEVPDYFNSDTNEQPNIQSEMPMDEPSYTIDETIQKPKSNQEIVYNPYPEIQQSVIQPLGEQNKAIVDENLKKSEQSTPKEVPKPSKKESLPDIINLATNDDLSIATIAREANRIREKQELQQEVVISLR